MANNQLSESLASFFNGLVASIMDDSFTEVHPVVKKICFVFAVIIICSIGVLIVSLLIKMIGAIWGVWSFE